MLKKPPVIMKKFYNYLTKYLIFSPVFISLFPAVLISCNQTNQIPSAAAIKNDLEANYHPQLKPEYQKPLSWNQYQDLIAWIPNSDHTTGAYTNFLNALVISPQAFYNQYPPKGLQLTIAKNDLQGFTNRIIFKITIWSAGDHNQLDAITNDFTIPIQVQPI